MARSLFDPAPLGALRLPNRIIMSSMSRDRSPGGVPTALNASYYAQRATAGTRGYEVNRHFAPRCGLAEHARHLHRGPNRGLEGRHRCSASRGRTHLLTALALRAQFPSADATGGALPVGPSAILPPGTIRTAEGRKPLLVPHELSADEIAGIVEEYRAAARNALVAGFDGVQVHAGNGFLLDQFLRDSANRRTDAYGGSAQNRCRTPRRSSGGGL